MPRIRSKRTIPFRASVLSGAVDLSSLLIWNTHKYTRHYKLILHHLNTHYQTPIQVLGIYACMYLLKTS